MTRNIVRERANKLVNIMTRENLVGYIGGSTPDKEVANEISAILIQRNIEFKVRYDDSMIEFILFDYR